MGLDAAVIHRVERARRRGRVSTPGLYLRAIARAVLLRHGAPQPHHHAGAARRGSPARTGDGDHPEHRALDLSRRREVNPNPDASFDLGLDVLAIRRLRVTSTARTVTQMLSRRSGPHGRHLLRLHDLDEFILVSDRPQAFQVDGDYLGERNKIRFRSVASALRVIC